jgi:acyl dehydratase
MSDEEVQDVVPVLPQGKIDAAMLERMRGLAGTQLRIDHSVNNEEVTRLAVQRFAEAIGDPNPLWGTARAPRPFAAPAGRGIAPPSFVMGCFSGIQFGWPGLGAFHSSSELTFHRPLFIGDTVTATCTYEGFDGPRSSSFATTMVIDSFRNTYHNQHRELVAQIGWKVMNFVRGDATRRRDARGSGDLPHRWLLEEVEAIEQEVLAEEPRGPQPRYWEDTELGEMLSPVTKGPIGMTDEVAYVAAGGPPIPRLAANGVALRQYRRHPDWAFRDPETMTLEPIYAVHYHRGAAQAMGAALQYDVGFQRQCWHTHLLTSWQGDDGWIVRSTAEYRGFVYHGDVVRLGGEVTAKRHLDEGHGEVDVRTWALNQRGQDVMPGSATIRLPRRPARNQEDRAERHD